MRAGPCEVQMERRVLDGIEVQAFGEGREQAEAFVPAHELCDHAEGPGDQDADEDGTGDLEVGQDGDDDEPDDAENDFGARERTEAEERGFICDDDAGALQCDDRDEEADTGGDAELQVLRDAVDDLLTELEERHQDEDTALDKDRCQSDGPGVRDVFQFTETDREGKVSVEAETGGQGDRIVRDECHQERCEGRCESRGDEDAVRVHDVTKDARVDRQDVGHGEERGQTGDDFRAHVRSAFFELEKSL